MDAIEFRLVGSADARTALRLSLASPGLSAAESEHHVSGFIQFAHTMSFALDRHVLCLRNGRPVAACTALICPGRTAMLFVTGGAVDPIDAPTLTRLVRLGVEQTRCEKLSLIQCLTVPGDARPAAALASAGFRELAVLRYMEQISNKASNAEPAPSDLAWSIYSPYEHAAFAKLIEATYEKSMDCTGLAGLRSIEDVIAGHKVAGLFDPRRWLLLRRSNEPAGCILLTRNPLRNAAEIVYMGVHPAHRGRNLGRVLVRQALALANVERFDSVTLAVDAGNTPALNLYQAEGFADTFARRAWIMPIRSSLASAEG